MASITSDPGGRRRILFVAPDGARKTVRLGKCDRKTAESICRHIEALLSARISGQPLPRETAVWLTGIGEPLRERLARAGLVESASRPAVPTLGQFLAEYLDNRSVELKRTTMIVMRQAARWLLRILGDDVRIDAVSVADADRFRAAILTGRARASANKWTRYAREFFNAAITRGLIEKNPFSHIKGLAVVGNRARRVFIPESEILRVLDAIPCPQFRLIVALARFAGLRIPSEALTLRWSDIDWEHDRVVIHASKTERAANGGIRVIPIFARLRPYLEAAWDAANEASEFVITRYRRGDQNLRTQFNRWCTSAGVVPWPKPFQNMRASIATELADQFPSHVCAAWLGHSERVADQFYRSVTDEHFQRAIRGAKSGAPAAQKAAQQATADSRQELLQSSESQEPQEDMRSLAVPCEILYKRSVGWVGIEPTSRSL